MVLIFASSAAISGIGFTSGTAMTGESAGSTLGVSTTGLGVDIGVLTTGETTGATGFGMTGGGTSVIRGTLSIFGLVISMSGLATGLWLASGVDFTVSESPRTKATSSRNVLIFLIGEDTLIVHTLSHESGLGRLSHVQKAQVLAGRLYDSVLHAFFGFWWKLIFRT